MRLTEEQINKIIEEEFINLINEEEIDEKLFDKLKNFGRGIISKLTKPSPNASAGVGRSFARYKVPQKQPIAIQPQTKPNTALAVKQPTTIEPFQEPSPDIERGTAKAYVHGYPQLQPASISQKQKISYGGELPATQKIPLQLPSPQKIGILSDYGKLMSSTEGQDYNNLYDSCINQFSSTPYYSKLNFQQKNVAMNNINTVLKHLVSTKRIIQNPTIGPLQEEEARPTPSLQQIGETEFNSWYARSLIVTTKKYFGKSIADEIIEFVIKFLFQSGRLAISQRLYNQLIHTNDPRLGPTDNLDSEQKTTKQESKSYNNFYNNWKAHIKSGVKI